MHFMLAKFFFAESLSLAVKWYACYDIGRDRQCVTELCVAKNSRHCYVFDNDHGYHAHAIVNSMEKSQVLIRFLTSANNICEILIYVICRMIFETQLVRIGFYVFRSATESLRSYQKRFKYVQLSVPSHWSKLN